MEEKVSIIVPCYNAEGHIERFLDSILNQTYRNLELILINDGSNDNTEKLIFQYEKKIQEKKIEFKYCRKKNGGAASAINRGLKLFTGDYLIWVDCDDFLHPKSIERRVNFLKQNPNYDLVRSNVKIVDEKNLEVKIGNFYNNYYKDEDIFLHLILEKIVVCPGAFMLKKKNVLRNIPTLNIYESKEGQNWQIELPNSYKQRCGFIDEELYTYVIRKNSHSHKKQNDLLIMIEKWKEHKKILDITIKNMNMPEHEKEKYLKIIENKYLKINLINYCKLLDKKKAKEIYVKLKKEEKVDLKIKLIYFLNKFGLLKVLLKLKKH